MAPKTMKRRLTRISSNVSLALRKKHTEWRTILKYDGWSKIISCKMSN